MTLINTSNKVINIGTDPILPDETRSITKALAETPSIKALAEMKLIHIVDDGKNSASEKKNNAKAEAPSATPQGSAPVSEPKVPEVVGNPENGAPVADDKKASQTKKK